MAKLKKEVGNKKHLLRRALLIAGVGVALIAAGVVATTMFSASPIVLLLEGAALLTGFGCIVGAGVALQKFVESVRVGKSKKVAKKSLKQIKTLNNDKTSKYSNNYRAKVIRKFANANLTLTKALGSTVYGVFHSNSGQKNEKATELLNQIDAYTLLRDSATSSSAQQKYSKKLKLAQEKLVKIVGDDVSITPFKWSKTYNNVLDGVTVIDRRTEIYCLSERAKESFISVFESLDEKTDKKALNVMVRFNGISNLKPTVAKAEDQTKQEVVKSILLADVIEACNYKTPEEIRAMFPITLESKIINKDTTKILDNSAVTFATISEVRAYISSSTRTK